MAKINDLIAVLAAGIAGDTAVQAWADLKYDRPLTVMENCDPRNDPGEGDCPLVILYPLSKSGGLNQSDKTHVIGFSCVVFDTGMPVSLEGVTRFTGGRLVEEMRELAVAAIRSSLPAGLHIESILTEYDTIEQFPYVSAGMEITFTQKKILGTTQDPYE